MLDVEFATATTAIGAVVDHGLGQLVGAGIALLLGDELVDGGHLGRVDEGTLYADGVVALQEEHVAATNELVGTHAVENGLRVDALAHLEGDARREVGLDGTRNDVGRGALCGYDHVDADGTGLLGDACDGELYLLAGSHDEVAVLVDDDDDVWHIAVAVLWIQTAFDELLVVVLDVSLASCHQQLVAGVHLDAERL